MDPTPTLNPEISNLKLRLKATWEAGDYGIFAKHLEKVFYKSMIQGELRAGVIPTSSLRYTDDGQIQLESYFGAFWLCKVSAPIEEKIEVKTDEPTVNRPSGVFS